MEHSPNSLRLSRWLRRKLQNGIHVDSSATAYMDSTFGTTDLPAILNTADSSETDSLLELLFFPDPALQADYEKQWGDAVFDSDDQIRVIEDLQASPPTISLTLADPEKTVRLEIPPYALDGMIRRLKITWQTPPAIDQTLKQILPDHLCLPVRVRLRNTEIQWSQKHIDLVILYLEKTSAEDRHFFEELDYLLELLGELMPDIAPFDFLTAKKQGLFDAWCKAETFERKRLSANMEILMLQGERAAYGDIRQIKHQIRLIDALCITLFGRTQYFAGPGEDCIWVESKQPDQILERVFKTLS
jgi:hypothetical protein